MAFALGHAASGAITRSKPFLALPARENEADHELFEHECHVAYARAQDHYDVCIH